MRLDKHTRCRHSAQTPALAWTGRYAIVVLGMLSSIAFHSPDVLLCITNILSTFTTSSATLQILRAITLPLLVRSSPRLLVE
jgi:hypothetical protein